MAKERKKKAATVSAIGGVLDGVLAKGLAHPMRAEILAYLNTQQKIASPAEMTRAGVGQARFREDEHKQWLSKMAYHIKILKELGLVTLVDWRPVRGSVEHFYEANTRMMLDLEEWSKLPDKAKVEVSVAAVEETLARAGQALAKGTFDTYDERAVINLALRLDRQAFIELAADMTDWMAHCEQKERDSIERAGGKVSELMHASASLLLYESPNPEKQPKQQTKRRRGKE
jgi:hypothetical protein